MSGKNISAPASQPKRASQPAPTHALEGQQTALLEKDVLSIVQKWLSLIEAEQLTLFALQAQLNGLLEQHAPGWSEGQWTLDPERGVLTRATTPPTPDGEPPAAES